MPTLDILRPVGPHLSVAVPAPHPRTPRPPFLSSRPFGLRALPTGCRQLLVLTGMLGTEADLWDNTGVTGTAVACGRSRSPSCFPHSQARTPTAAAPAIRDDSGSYAYNLCTRRPGSRPPVPPHPRTSTNGGRSGISTSPRRPFAVLASHLVDDNAASAEFETLLRRTRHCRTLGLVRAPRRPRRSGRLCVGSPRSAARISRPVEQMPSVLGDSIRAKSGGASSRVTPTTRPSLALLKEPFQRDHVAPSAVLVAGEGSGPPHARPVAQPGVRSRACSVHRTHVPRDTLR